MSLILGGIAGLRDFITTLIAKELKSFNPPTVKEYSLKSASDSVVGEELVPVEGATSSSGLPSSLK